MVANKCCAYAITPDWRWNLNVRNYCDHLKLIMTIHILVMHIESKFVGTFLVKSSATTAVPELRFSTCQCTCAITHSWRWDGITNDGITNEVLVERLYRTSSGKFCSFVLHSSSLSMAWVADSDIFGWQGNLLPVKLLQYRLYNRFAIQYLSGFFDITRGAWISVRNSARVTYYQNLVACSKRLDPLSTIAHRGRGSWAKPLVLHYWKYSTLFILTFWNFRMYTPYLDKFVWFFKSLLLMNGHLKSINLTSLASTIKWNTIEFFMLLISQSSIQTHNHKLERTLRIFQGHWRSQSKQFREFKLAHIRDLVKFLLQNSFFHVGTQVFRQHRGASMGSQWAPILCSAVALMREYNFFQVYPMLTIELIRRFSDSPGNNRFFCGLPHFGAIVCVNRYSKRFSFDESIMFGWSREFCYAVWAETCRNLFGQELSNNSSSFCSSGTQNFHLPTYLCVILFLTMRWNYKWGLGWKALSYSLVHRFHFELKRIQHLYTHFL